MDGYYHYYHLVHDLDSKKVLDGLHLVFVELPKFKAKNLTERKMQVLWLRFLTEIAPDGSDEVSQDLLDNPQTGEALEIVRESGLNDAERAAYDGFWDRVSIEATKKAYMDKAITERDAAVAERDAAVEKLRQTARNLKAMNLTNEQIAAATGLSVGEIDKLK
jgi:predicted transposase/invertase (TIGR01784 family)